MAQSDDLLKGIGIGLGLALLVPVAVSALAPVLRPVARSALKTGIWAYEKARESFEELGESFDDIVAEVQEELAQARESGEEGSAGDPASEVRRQG
jgi:hypothetical protein